MQTESGKRVANWKKENSIIQAKMMSAIDITERRRKKAYRKPSAKYIKKKHFQFIKAFLECKHVKQIFGKQTSQKNVLQ